MKPVPSHISASGPPGTAWYGGEVDRSTVTLRVAAKVQGEWVDKKEIARMLGHESDDQTLRHWSLRAPAREGADLDWQVDWLLSRLTYDLVIWQKLTEGYRVDIFCGLFLERENRGVTLGPKAMAALGARGIEMGFDIYAPEKASGPAA